jgi:hypothetical protein
MVEISLAHISGENGLFAKAILFGEASNFAIHFPVLGATAEFATKGKFKELLEATGFF